MFHRSYGATCPANPFPKSFKTLSYKDNSHVAVATRSLIDSFEGRVKNIHFILEIAYNGQIEMGFPAGLMNEPKFSNEQRMADDMSFCGLESSS